MRVECLIDLGIMSRLPGTSSPAELAPRDILICSWELPPGFRRIPSGKREARDAVCASLPLIRCLARQDRRRRTESKGGVKRGRKTIIRLIRWLSSKNGDSSPRSRWATVGHFLPSPFLFPLDIAGRWRVPKFRANLDLRHRGKSYVPLAILSLSLSLSRVFTLLAGYQAAMFLYHRLYTLIAYVLGVAKRLDVPDTFRKQL